MNNRTTVIVEHTSDTTTIVRIDTIYREKTVVRSEKVLDTIFIEKVPESGLSLAFTQKYYKDESYEAWVSGCRPSLDSVRVFQKVVREVITNNIEKKVYPRTRDLYFNVEGLVIGKDIAPNIGASLKFRNDIMVSAKVGYYRHEPYYGIGCGIKLNRNGK